MSSTIDIGYGGAISVDPQALRDTAARMAVLGTDFDEAARAVRSACALVSEAAELGGAIDTTALQTSADRARQLGDECDSAVEGTRLMADVYEYTELKAEADALAISDQAAADALYLRMEALAQDPRVADMSATLVRGWEESRYEGATEQWLPGGLGILFGFGGMTGSMAGRNKIWPWTTFTRLTHDVEVCPVKTSSPSGPPTSFAGAFERMPETDGAQIAIEKYTMPDGEEKFVAYIKGTQALGLGGEEPWDMQSNYELYTGTESASYQATLDALAAAGAEPGDEVDVVAHSQAGMIAAHLSMNSEFDVHVQITAGSPQEPTLDDDQTLVQFRHTDDLVNDLAGGGSPGGTGSPDSFTVTREGSPGPDLHDMWMGTNLLDTYIETAEMADESGDPRVEAMDDFWNTLGEAVEVERTEYRAERNE